MRDKILDLLIDNKNFKDDRLRRQHFLLTMKNFVLSQGRCQALINMRFNTPQCILPCSVPSQDFEAQSRMPCSTFQDSCSADQSKFIAKKCFFNASVITTLHKYIN